MSAALIDTHAHLDGDAFAADVADVVGRAGAAGVAQIVSVGQDEASSRAALEIAERFEAVWSAVGIHPHLAHSAGDATWLARAAAHPRVVAIGETGLDYHYNYSPPEAQREVFARQLALAGELGLPAIMHNRESDDDLAAMLRAHFGRGRLGVVHCFTGSFDAGARLIDEFDVYLGIGGAVTFKNAKMLHDAAARLPLERLVLETDCPFMAPVPNRGKRNEPAFIVLTAARLAELRGASAESVARATTANAQRLFPRLPAG